MNFPFIYSNIPAAHLSVDRYSRACGYYPNFHDRGLLLTRKLLNQGLLVVTGMLKSSLRKFYGRHLDLVNRYGIFVSQMIRYFPGSRHRVCNECHVWSRSCLPFRSTRVHHQLLTIVSLLLRLMMVLYTI